MPIISTLRWRTELLKEQPSAPSNLTLPVVLTDANFYEYAVEHYNNPHCFDHVEFEDDMKTFKYIKRLLKKYKETGHLKERLILNHIIILNNVFGPVATTRMLFLKLQGYYSSLLPFLDLLQTVPPTIENIINETRINVFSIARDPTVVQALQMINNQQGE